MQPIVQTCEFDTCACASRFLLSPSTEDLEGGDIRDVEVTEGARRAVASRSRSRWAGLRLRGIQAC